MLHQGDVFGKETPITLVLLDIPPMAQVLEGVQFELQDCALSNLQGENLFPFLLKYSAVHRFPALVI